METKTLLCLECPSFTSDTNRDFVSNVTAGAKEKGGKEDKTVPKKEKRLRITQPNKLL